MRYMSRHHTVQDKLMFIFSAKNLTLLIYIIKVKAFTYIQQGKFGFTEKGKPTIIDVV